MGRILETKKTHSITHPGAGGAEPAGDAPNVSCDVPKRE